MVEAVRRTEKVLGNVTYEVNAVNRELARSLYVVEDIKKGEIFTEKNIRSIRPNFGLHTRYYQTILGKKATQDLERGTALAFGHIEGKI